MSGIIRIDDVPVICAECNFTEIRGDYLWCSVMMRKVYNAKPKWYPIEEEPERR